MAWGEPTAPIFMDSHLAVYAGLFLASFAAATVLPFQSEVALVGLLLA